MFPPHPAPLYAATICSKAVVAGMLCLLLLFTNNSPASPGGLDAPEAVTKFFNGKFSSSATSLGSAPATLSLSTLFENLTTLTPRIGLMPYDVNSPAWADGAQARRWLSLPNNGAPITSTQKITNSGTDAWVFPVGSVIVKHFDLPIDDTNPALLKKVETQVLVLANSSIWYALTYRWRDDQSDADLVPGSPDVTRNFTIPTGPSTSRTQTWTYLSRTKCIQCHNTGAGTVLGLNTHQLNGYLTYARTGRTSNQLHTLNTLGFFSTTWTESYILNSLPNSVRHDDFTQPLEKRARSYLDANCAGCHRTGGTSPSRDLRLLGFETRPTIINAPSAMNHSVLGEGWLRPADVGKSMIHFLSNQLGASQMPPLGKSRIDTQGMLTLAEWINSLSGYSLPGPSGLQANYYSDNNLTTLKLQRTDTQINNNWGADRPTTLVGTDNFSATWSGYLYLPTTGTFTLSIDSDDGIQLLTAGQFIINGWTLSNPTRKTRTGLLSGAAGKYLPVTLRYREFTGDALCIASWSGPGVDPIIIPPEHFFQTATPSPAPPFAANDSATLLRGSSLVLPLTANDTDFENDLAPGTITISQPPAFGTVTIGSGGNVTYNSHPTTAGTSDSFLYTVDDATGRRSNRALVALTIQADYRNWKNLHFTAYEQSVPSLSDWDADPDADGQSNLLEYSSNTDPRSPASRNTPLLTRPTPGTLQIRYPKRPGADITYTFESTTTLAQWTPANVAILENTSDHFLLELPLSNSPAKTYLRMRTTLIP